jgi:hypothetical protein
VRALGVLCAAAVAAGCGGGSDHERDGADGLSHDGISIDVPADWDGRVLGCFEGRCLRVTVDFATPPPPTQLTLANLVLASLAVQPER